jgi:hypothetical protein
MHDARLLDECSLMSSYETELSRLVDQLNRSTPGAKPAERTPPDGVSSDHPGLDRTSIDQRSRWRSSAQPPT